MIRPIFLLGGPNPFRSEEGFAFTGWYSIERLAAEGPYENIVLPHGSENYVPKSGPLANTKTNTPSLCDHERALTLRRSKS